MDHQSIKALIELVNNSNIGEVKIEQGNFKLSIRHKDYHPKNTIQVNSQHPALNASTVAVPVAPAIQEVISSEKIATPPPGVTIDVVEDTSKYVTIHSPMIGTFFRTPSPDKDPFIKVGDTIEKGDILCIIEAMKLFNEISSEFSGTIVKVLVDNATPVEYDQPLFLIDPN